MSGRAIALVAVVAAACTTVHPFDEQLARGRWEDAVRTFEADSALWSSPAALLEVGSLYADRALPTFSQERAQAALTRLTTEFPLSPEAQRGRPLLALMADLEALRGELQARTAALEGRVALTDSLVASRDAAERDLQSVRRRVEMLEAELEEARRELERLKAVDLRPRPGATR